MPTLAGRHSRGSQLLSIQFERSDVPAIVRETLDATRLPANRLEIEITESTLLRDSSRTIADLRRLEELGVTISVDDFGTAYSSLSYLHSLPLHKVKIDQSFLQGVGSNERRVTLLRGMARLSTQLGLRVVVEGVETEDQLEGGAADVFGSGSGNGAAHPAVDVKSLHAKIGELTLENDFLGERSAKPGTSTRANGRWRWSRDVSLPQELPPELSARLIRKDKTRSLRGHRRYVLKHRT